MTLKSELELRDARGGRHQAAQARAVERIVAGPETRNRLLDPSECVPRGGASARRDVVVEGERSARDIMNGAFECAFVLLQERRSVLEAGARKLLQQETSDQSELTTLQNAPPLAGASSASADR